MDFSFLSSTAPSQTVNQSAFTTNAQQPIPAVGAIAAVPNGVVTPQNVSGIADALMGGAKDPVAQGNVNAQGWMTKLGGTPGLSFMLASIGSALSARDPNSWQHQLSNTAKIGAQTSAKARGDLIGALSQKIQPSTSSTKTFGPMLPDYKSALGGTNGF